jgi:integrase
MTRTIGKLNALRVDRIKQPGYYGDGGGLWLQVTTGADGTPRKSWVYRFMLTGRSREMGLGPLSLFGLHDARAKALDARRLCYEGIDPIEARRTARSKAKLEAAKAITFKECAEAYVRAHRAGWRNHKHAAQWDSTLATYAYPVIGALAAQAIDTSLVIRILEPIWNEKPETASRLRGRIEAVLDWAKVRGYREGDNPARWRGHLDKLLPARSKVRRVQHHAALPYSDLPACLELLRAREGVAARALEFTILTAARTAETIGATWNEIDFQKKVWSLPAHRMKAGREHLVPLGPRAIQILEEARSNGKETDPSRYTFVSDRQGKRLSNMALLMLLRRMGFGEFTAHGFRSTFRDWAAERTNYPNEVAEMALAHTISDKVEAAYRRGTLFERRVRLMNDWANFCTDGTRGSC